MATLRSLAALRLPSAQLVWVAAARRGIGAHQHIDGQRLTPCGENTAIGGTLIVVGEAIARWGASACPRCWPTTIVEAGGER